MPKPDLTWDDPEFDDVFENFVGRADKLNAFKDNFTGERPKWMVLSITGDGGVGKSTLLKQFIRMAQSNEIKANLIYCDDHYLTPVEVMGFVAEELAKLKIKNGEFDERYSKYRQLREQVEKDPNVPGGLLDLGTYVVTDIALDAASRVPGLGMVGKDGFKQSAGSAMAEAGKYVLSRWSNKDEVHLLREPEKTLTPLFVNLLNEATEKQRQVIMLDVFERSEKLLSPWLLNLFSPPLKYGKLSAWVSFVISGRDQLNQRWTDLGKRLTRLALEPFELKETREYLINRSITDEALIEQIHNDTGGLPVLVELLAATNPQPGQPLRDITSDAVERFLQWTPNEMHSVPLLAAIPRQFNKDVLIVLLGDDAEVKFEWLVEQSYIRSESKRGWFYHDKVRTLMLRHQHNLSPKALEENHSQLAAYFTALQADLQLTVREAYRNQTWQQYELERVYHLFSTAPKKYWTQIVNAFIPAFYYRRRFSTRLVDSAKQVLDEVRSADAEQDVLGLEALLNAHEKDQHDQVIHLLNRFQKLVGQNNAVLVAFLSIRGDEYREMKQNDAARSNFEQILAIDPSNAPAIAGIGGCYVQQNEYGKALDSFSRAIDLDKEYAWAIAMRGLTYRLLSKYDESLKDFNAALSLEDQNASMLAHRGETYRLMVKYDEALKDFDRAIELDEKYSWAIEQRSEIYRVTRKYQEALRDLDKLIANGDNSPSTLFTHAELLRKLEHFSDALNEFNELIVSLSDKVDIHQLVRRAVVYKALGNQDAANTDLEKALAIPCKDFRDHYNRATIFLVNEQLIEALLEFDQAFTNVAARDFSVSDDLLDPLRNLPEFKALLAKYS